MTVSINGTNGITFFDSSTQATAATGFGFKNRLINGSMAIDQRNAGASVSVTNSGPYTVDRWQAYNSVAASKFTVQQTPSATETGYATRVGAGFTNYLACTSSSAYSLGVSDYFVFYQKVEGLNFSDMAWGTASAKTVTLSFWVYSSLTGTFGGAIQNSAQNRNYTFSYSIPVANTWTQISITVAGDTSGTWLTTSGIGAQIFFSLGAGSSAASTAGSWGGTGYFGVTGQTNVVATSGATFYITGVQLEKGSTATSFDYRPYGTELALCQRYFEVLTGETSGVLALHWSYGGSTTNQWHYWYMKATKRAAATVTKVGGTWTNATPTIYSGVDVIAFNATGSAYINVAAGVVALTASAEL